VTRVLRHLAAAATLTGALAAQSGSPCFEPAFGTLLGVDDDFVFPAITLSAPFPAFGNLHAQVQVSSNGFVWLGGTPNFDSGCCSGTGTGLASGAARIAAFWTDLVTDGQNGSGVYHGTVPGGDVITWVNAFESFDPTIRFTVQLQLLSTGAFTVWFHPATGIAQVPHTAVVGASPGGLAVVPPPIDISASLPVNSGTQPMLYEEWATSTFDLGASALEFTPNGNGGWLLQDRPGCPFVAGTWSTFGVGCPAQTGIFGASFYETFTGASLDLDNLEFVLIPTGSSGYLVQAITGAFFPGFTNVVPLTDDDVLDQILPFNFPNPGGVCTTVGFCSNGFLWLDNFNNSPPAAPFVPSFLQDGPRLAGLWTDLDFTAGGNAYFDATPTVAYFTWFDAPDFSNPSLRSTFQVQLFANGNVRLCYQGLNVGANRPALAGYGVGGQTWDPGSIDLSASVPFVSGAGLLPVTLDWIGVPPVLGQPFPLVAGNLRPSALLGVLVVGVQQFNPGLPLAGIGMPGCFAHTSLDVTFAFPTTGFTTPINVLSFPPTLAAAGFTMYSQLAVLDPGITPFGLAASNGGTITVGMY
jgi:hypothetical protein